MKKILLSFITFALLPTCLFAVDGQVLISQASVTAAGGFPFVISQPGSYKLSGNLIPPGGRDAIHINSNDVTLDLNGFTIGFSACVPKNCSGTGYGVLVDPSHPYYHITVRNGGVSGMAVGVALNGDSFTVEDLHVQSSIDAYGVFIYSSAELNPSNVIVRRNTFDGGLAGLVVTGSPLVTENAFSNGRWGAMIQGIEGGGLVSGNTFRRNTTAGLQIFQGGYSNNVFSAGGPTGGTNLGGNLCNSSLCP